MSGGRARCLLGRDFWRRITPLGTQSHCMRYRDTYSNSSSQSGTPCSECLWCLPSPHSSARICLIIFAKKEPATIQQPPYCIRPAVPRWVLLLDVMATVWIVSRRPWACSTSRARCPFLVSFHLRAAPASAVSSFTARVRVGSSPGGSYSRSRKRAPLEWPSQGAFSHSGAT